MAILTMMGGKMVVEPQTDAEAKELEELAYAQTKVDVEKKAARKPTPKPKADEKPEVKVEKAKADLEADDGSDSF